jgi:hypothetical protein
MYSCMMAYCFLSFVLRIQCRNFSQTSGHDRLRKDVELCAGIRVCNLHRYCPWALFRHGRRAGGYCIKLKALRINGVERSTKGPMKAGSVQMSEARGQADSSCAGFSTVKMVLRNLQRLNLCYI